MSVTEESVRVHKRLPIEGVACRAYLNTGQGNITSSSWVKVTINAVTYDLGKNFATDTYKFTAPVSGLYNIIGQVFFDSTGVQADKRYVVSIFKNGVAINESEGHASVADYVSVNIQDEVYLAKDDYIELYAYTTGTGNTVDILGDANGLYTYLVIRLISKEGIRQ